MIVYITFVLHNELDINQIMYNLYASCDCFLEICFDVIKHVSIFAE